MAKYLVKANSQVTEQQIKDIAPKSNFYILSENNDHVLRIYSSNIINYPSLLKRTLIESDKFVSKAYQSRYTKSSVLDKEFDVLTILPTNDFMVLTFIHMVIDNSRVVYINSLFEVLGVLNDTKLTKDSVLNFDPPLYTNFQVKLKFDAPIGDKLLDKISLVDHNLDLTQVPILNIPNNYYALCQILLSPQHAEDIIKSGYIKNVMCSHIDDSYALSRIVHCITYNMYFQYIMEIEYRQGKRPTVPIYTLQNMYDLPRFNDHVYLPVPSDDNPILDITDREHGYLKDIGDFEKNLWKCIDYTDLGWLVKNILDNKLGVITGSAIPLALNSKVKSYKLPRIDILVNKSTIWDIIQLAMRSKSNVRFSCNDKKDILTISTGVDLPSIVIAFTQDIVTCCSLAKSNVMRAYYDGEELYMLPTALMGYMEGIAFDYVSHDNTHIGYKVFDYGKSLAYVKSRGKIQAWKLDNVRVKKGMLENITSKTNFDFPYIDVNTLFYKPVPKVLQSVPPRPDRKEEIEKKSELETNNSSICRFIDCDSKVKEPLVTCLKHIYRYCNKCYEGEICGKRAVMGFCDMHKKKLGDARCNEPGCHAQVVSDNAVCIMHLQSFRDVKMCNVTYCVRIATKENNRCLGHIMPHKPRGRMLKQKLQSKTFIESSESEDGGYGFSEEEEDEDKKFWEEGTLGFIPLGAYVVEPKSEKDPPINPVLRNFSKVDKRSNMCSIDKCHKLRCIHSSYCKEHAPAKIVNNSNKHKESKAEALTKDPNDVSHILYKAKNTLCEFPYCEEPQLQSADYCKRHKCRECDSKIVKVSVYYCKTHVCGYENCTDKSVYSGYCTKHRDVDTDRCNACTKPVYGDALYCIEHICDEYDCNNCINDPDDYNCYCEEHRCRNKDCLKKAIWSGYCTKHIPNKDNESERKTKGTHIDDTLVSKESDTMDADESKTKVNTKDPNDVSYTT